MRFPGGPIVLRPTLADALMVMAGHIDMDEVETSAASHFVEGENDDRVRILCPELRRPPRLHDHLAPDQHEVPPAQRTAKGGESAADTAADLGRCSGDTAMLPRIEKGVEQIVGRGLQDHGLANGGRHSSSPGLQAIGAE